MHEKEYEVWQSVFSRSENSALEMSHMNEGILEGISPVSVHSGLLEAFVHGWFERAFER